MDASAKAPDTAVQGLQDLVPMLTSASCDAAGWKMTTLDILVLYRTPGPSNLGLSANALEQRSMSRHPRQSLVGKASQSLTDRPHLMFSATRSLPSNLS